MKTKQTSQLGVLLAAFAISLALFFGSDLAQADVIVDTGSTTGPYPGGGGALYQSQWLAAEFTLPANATISDIQGWIYCVEGQDNCNAGQVTFAIYTSSNNVYGDAVPANVIYSTSINVPTNTTVGWTGPSGLNLGLTPGKYWLAFEVQSGSYFLGYMPGGPPSPLPLAFIYFPFGPNWNWAGVTSQSLGVQIHGTVGSVLSIPLNIQSISNSVVLSWNDPASVFTLQAAPTVSGVFTNVPSVSSPYTNAITNPQQYFRLVYPAN
jgi:hypothetical protein